MTRGTTVRAPSVAAEKALPDVPGGVPHRRAVRKEPWRRVLRRDWRLYSLAVARTGRRVTAGEVLHLEPTDVMVLREDPS